METVALRAAMRLLPSTCTTSLRASHFENRNGGSPRLIARGEPFSSSLLLPHPRVPRSTPNLLFTLTQIDFTSFLQTSDLLRIPTLFLNTPPIPQSITHSSNSRSLHRMNIPSLTRPKIPATNSTTRTSQPFGQLSRSPRILPPYSHPILAPPTHSFPFPLLRRISLKRLNSRTLLLRTLHLNPRLERPFSEACTTR
jgi:hypothetical protein